MAEIVLLIISFILAILYGIELLKNIKLEKERDINKLELQEKVKHLLKVNGQILKEKTEFKNKLNEEIEQMNSNSDYTMELVEENSILKERIEQKNKRIALLCSKVQNREKIIAKLRKNERKV